VEPFGDVFNHSTSLLTIELNNRLTSLYGKKFDAAKFIIIAEMLSEILFLNYKMCMPPRLARRAAPTTMTAMQTTR
jgi:hypothetical protein